MGELVKICNEGKLPKEGEVREFSAGGRAFCVARCDGQIAVLDNQCPHEDGPLGEGILENGRVVCPWHAWAFDLKTGEAEHPLRAKVLVYDVIVDRGEVLVRLP